MKKKIRRVKSLSRRILGVFRGTGRGSGLASHSPELLGHPAVTGERVRVIEWRDGTSHICCLNPETQAAVNGIDTAGWMLSANALWTSREPETCSGDLLALDDARP
jgi:hypothetical protein